MLFRSGVPQKIVDDFFAAMRQFFEKPDGFKMDYRRDKWPIMRGYEPLLWQQLDEGTPRDLKESFYIATEHAPDHPGVVGKWPNHGANPWPADLPGFREKVEAYFYPMLDLGRRLMRLIALSLELPRDYFDEAFATPAANLRMLRYPPHPDDAEPNQLGAGAHTDFEIGRAHV